MSELSYLEKLLDGVEVEWKTLEDISIKISSGGTPKTGVSEFYDGDIPWLRTQEVNFCDIWDTEVKITESGVKNSSAKWIPKNCVIVAMYGATVGKIGINKIPMTTNQACANIQLNEEVAHYRYVFHFLCSQYTYIKSLGTGSQTNINAQIVKNIKIPIPCPDNPEKSLAIQSEIVRILDKFTALTAELTAELNMRKKQYNYYRDQLLSFKEGEVNWTTLGNEELFHICAGGTPSKSKAEYWDNGSIPWLKSESCNNKPVYFSKDFISELGLKKSTAKLLPKNTTLIALVGATIFKTAFLEFEATTNQNIASIKSTKENIIADKFIFYFLTNLYNTLKSEMRNYGMLNLTNLRQFRIPIPCIAEQKRIVSILDKFDALTNSITEGLPREIELRQKQYEYYRDLLFSFPKPETVSN
ncbi:TPA: restriction endonuclease subunit S [Escherichia coli]|uniref:Type-1 restriction enzyme specificity protein n=1 Tax=Escherichia coli TaxID=562 RepID=A0A2S1JBG2_ECOLX|nr:restriction endonuclease subunit S [Escherichia coli]AUY94030.1 restriction endonuclease subunit S [Escherichia coli]AWF75622.1 Putative type-1 restriction enzyme specificity protein [Escherichia coli]MBA0918153.1 restriction endonuclease subunit S [Escherichia coli]MCV5694495.1 restriction endonuclease subunit S [Escherichia coli]MCV5734329.1 restriction endonuclease subunit S [Escherichia coli]